MCYNPITVNYHPSYKNYRGLLIHPYNKGRVVNCGKCLECREQYIESWQIRWMEQLKVSQQYTNYMITLTYDDQNIPTLVTPDGEIKTTLYYPDVQKFIKRLRKAQETYCKKNNIENPSIKYHGCGEYGKNFTKRPHYHILITNYILPPETIHKIWGKGRVHIGDEVTDKTINYILKYTLKTYHSDQKPQKLIKTETITKTIIPFTIYDFQFGAFKNAWYGNLPFPKNYSFQKTILVDKKTVFKYYPKGTPNEYRIAEKTFLSKGIGANYLTKKSIQYHLENPYSTYDYYDVKKRIVKQKPLPRYYHQKIYNPIKQIDGKNQYDENKKPIYLNDKKDLDSYIKTPLFQKQKAQYEASQLKEKALLKKYKNDMHLLVKTESHHRKIRKNIAQSRQNKIFEFQRHTNLMQNNFLI